MTEAPDPAARPGPVSLIVFSGSFERVHYALCIAATAAAVGSTATLLFTGSAIGALVAASGDEPPAWRKLPGEDGRSGGAIDDGYRVRGVAGFEELLQACSDLGVRLIACEMGLRIAGLDRAALRGDLNVEEAGLATFLADAPAAGSITFI